MDIPALNITVTKAAVNGQILDVVDYEEYVKHKEVYLENKDSAIPYNHNGKDILLPIKGKYTGNHINPGVYNAGVIDFLVLPETGFEEKYVPQDTIVMSNNTDIKELIEAGDKAKKLDEPFITTPDSVTNIPIRDTDQPEMKCLKLALNAKHMDIDKYASRFGETLQYISAYSVMSAFSKVNCR